uniref:Methyltransferase n=1 Tax=viral metagenome TaxID=1070528 RepID=A0A6C0JWS9_9ZZZZ
MGDISTNKIYELGTKYETDKVTHHEYHPIYDFFLKQFYNTSGAMLEIGVQHGNSLNMWLELFTNAHIFGMDIDKEYSGERYSIIKGDQSKSDDLQNLCNIISHKGLFFINDDGSHIPEHQLLTFNTLFPSLEDGGVYIIEDIETSYWTKNGLYGYETHYGYKHPNSIIEIFKEVADSVNSEFSGQRQNRVMHHHMIGSITFSRNCIIIVKQTRPHRYYRYWYNL